MNKEIWKDIVGYEGLYQVSNFGRIKSLYNYRGKGNILIPRLKHDNNFETDMKQAKGYWLDAFYPSTEPTTYIFGDVWFTDEAIKTIVNYESDSNVLFGTGIARNKEHQNWGEPFAYIVNNTDQFVTGIKEVKKLYDEGKTVRHPIVWELYRYLHGLDINIQRITDDYVNIDDGTIDIDYPEIINEIERY